MAEIFYTDVSGAVLSKVFGCSFKSINAEMGFNSNPTKFTITVVEENPGDFTLTRASIRDVQEVTFGELSVLGIVDSYERTTLSNSGSGIYTIVIEDMRTVLETVTISNMGTRSLVGAFPASQPQGSLTDVTGSTDHTPVIRHNLIAVSTPSGEPPPDDVNREEEQRVAFGTMFDDVERSVLYYGGREFELDMSAFDTLVDSQGNGISQHSVEGPSRSLISTINEFCNKVGVEWYVTSRRKSVTDEIFVISIRTVDRFAQPEVDTLLTLDDIAALHSDHIISRKDGFEKNDTVTHKYVWGGIRRNLQRPLELDTTPNIFGGLQQFWGFNENGIPLTTPSYIVPGDPPNRRTDTSIQEMENALNGDLDGTMNTERLRELKRYLNSFWGRKFWFNAGPHLEAIPAGWWEGQSRTAGTTTFNDYPNGLSPFFADILLRMSSDDGRYGPFVRLDDILLTYPSGASGSVVPHFVTWAPAVTRSNDIMRWSDIGGADPRVKKYMKCAVAQFGSDIIISLPSPLTRYVIDEETGVVDEARISRHTTLEDAWIPMMDRRVHYGPWSTIDGSDQAIALDARRSGQAAADNFSYGMIESLADRDLVPWAFGGRGVTHASGEFLMGEAAYKKITFRPEEILFQTGQLEVAGIPAVNIGESLQGGSSITEIFIRFDANGITTKYVSNLNTRERGNSSKKGREKRLEDERKEIKDEIEPDDELPEILEDIEDVEDIEDSDLDISDELEDALEETDNLEPQGPSNETLEFIYDKPDGGLGVISVKEGGPFYAVRRLDYQDIDPESYAGGFDITGSFFLSEWTGTRNLAEPDNSPGLLAVGTRVTVSIFSQEGLDGPYLPYMEQTPQVFSPPVT
jgi:hypothetical protein